MTRAQRCRSSSDLIDTFPFVAQVDRSVALSGILTALDRRSMATAPLHAFTAPVAGTGKSLLVDIIAMLATGEIDAGDRTRAQRRRRWKSAWRPRS